jgi:hypothetical protein
MQIICESILHTIIKIKIIIFQYIQVIKIKQKNFTKQLYPTSKKKNFRITTTINQDS